MRRNPVICYALQVKTLLKNRTLAPRRLWFVNAAGRLNPKFLFELGFAYYSAGRYEEATVTLKKLLSYNPNLLHVQLVLALAFSGAGREEEARAVAVEILRINPNFSVEVMKQRALNTDPATVEWSIAALRKAGVK